MRKKITSLIIISFMAVTAARAEFAFSDPADFTGEAFFSTASPQSSVIKTGDNGESKHTTPPIKQLRLMWQEKRKMDEYRNSQFAPTAADIYKTKEKEENKTSKYASQEPEENFDEQVTPDGFEADEQAVEELKIDKKAKKAEKKKKKAKKTEPTEEVILDCQNVDYDAPNYVVKATGNVSVRFVKQGTTVKADLITFDRLNNTIKAEGNVRILKSGHTITGDYIFVDLNEENALIENPLTRTATFEIKSEKGYVYGDRIVQEKGNLVVNDTYPIEVRSGNRGPKVRKMIQPNYPEEDPENKILRLKAKDIKITQKGDLEIIALKRAHILKGHKTIFKTPSIKLYTNKNHDYGETNHWEIGSFRGLGMYAGPGVVFELPKGSVLKAMPILNYKSDFGIGAMTRFSSGTNHTMFAYGSAMDKFFALGTQKLDDHLSLEYGMNSYMNEWFLGRRRPKYGMGLVYRRNYSAKDFLLKGQYTRFGHRVDAGYYHDLDFDSKFEKIKGDREATSRFRYMAAVGQDFYSYTNKEKQIAFSLGAAAQLAASVYGTGDTQVIARVAPRVHTQYKRWMQDILFFVSAIDDHTPMPVYDKFRYGKQNIYLREYFRVNRYLTLAWFTSYNVTNDAPNGKDFQEQSFYISVGPDDIKMNLGYDFVRENLYCIFDIKMDAKGTKVEYDTLEIKQDKKAQKRHEAKQKTSNFETAKAQPELQRAVVENIKVQEDVL